MVRRNLTRGVLAGLVLLVACDRNQDMPERVEMPDPMPIIRAMEDAQAMDSMLDTLPGGGDGARGFGRLDGPTEEQAVREGAPSGC
jgi:hypothetical protein